jgi:NTE family protein
VWTERSKVSLGRLGTGFRLQLGADTGIGPLYLGLSFATQCQPGLVLFIGRP